MCITADSAAVNTGRITQEIKGHSRPVTHRAHGLQGQKGDCNLIPAFPSTQDRLQPRDRLTV